MTDREPGEGTSNSGILELEGPAELEPGQNFLDQPPFGPVLEQIGQTSRIDLSNLRKIYLAIATSSRFTSEVFNGSPALWGYQRSSFNELFKKGRSLAVERDRRDDYFRAMADIFKLLSDYPYIKDYFQSKFDRGLYGIDGAWNVVASGNPSANIIKTESYAKWVTKKQAREGKLNNQVLLGIDEIFPQDFGRSKTGLVGYGVKTQHRRWRILKAAELVSEKR